MRRIAFFQLLSVVLPLLASCGGSSGGSPAPAPAATSLEATSIGGDGATLNGSVNPNGLPTQAWFEYGTDPGLQAYSSAPRQDAGNGLVARSLSASVGALAPGTIYYFRVCAESSGGRTAGQILSFTTASPGSAPVVTSLAATAVGATGATLNGTVNPSGLETTAWFEWGTSPSLVTFSTSPTQALGAGTSALPVAATLSGLTPGTTYYYRVAASNSAAPASGSIESFPTESPGVFGVVSTTPANGATDVPLGSIITVTFNDDVEPATLVDAIAVSSSSGALAGVISYNSTTRTAIFTPGTPLTPLTGYTVTVATKVKSVHTVRLSSPYVFSFRSA